MGHRFGNLCQKKCYKILLVQTKMSCNSLLTVWDSRQPLRIKVQSCPVLR